MSAAAQEQGDRADVPTALVLRNVRTWRPVDRSQGVSLEELREDASAASSGCFDGTHGQR